MSNEIAQYEDVMQVAQKEQSLIETFLEPSLKSKAFMFASREVQAWPEDKKDQFLKQTMIEIAHDENLKECFNSSEGKMSILKAVQKAAGSGLEIGGKHAYLVPQRRNVAQKNQPAKWITEARFSIRDRGYHALLCGGSRPIFRDLRWGQVYEGDECSIDEGTGEIVHKKKIGKSNGDFLGVWVQCVKMNGNKEAKFYPENKINQWREASKTDEVWKKWPEEMALQASIRHFCDRYEVARDLLASAIYDEDGIVESEKSNTEAIDEKLTEPEIEEEIIDAVGDEETDDDETSESGDSSDADGDSLF